MLYEEKADPGTTSFIPRPDWYFYFLYLLRIKRPDSVVLGTVGIPTIALILLLALLFLDSGRSGGLRRPVAMIAALLTIATMGVLTYGRGRGGGTARRGRGPLDRGEQHPRGRGAGGRPALRRVRLHELPHLPRPRRREPRRSRPSGIGRRRGPEAYISNPREFGNQVMPVYGETLSEEQLGQIAAFLEASKGSSGGRSVTARTGHLPADGVRTMFDRIAPVYDAMNHAMTAGLDRRWRRLAADAVVAQGDRVLDACCVTGDLALAASSAVGS